MALLGPLLEKKINPHILNEYDFEVKNAIKKRSLIKVESQLGTFGIRKTKLPLNQLDKMMGILEFLKDKGYPVPTILRNKFGEYFIPSDDGIIYVSEWIDGKELTLNHQPHLLKATNMMARLHDIGFSYKPERPIEENTIKELQIRNIWENQLVWLKKYNKYIGEKRLNSNFEVRFQSYIPFLADWAEEAIEYLNQWVIEYETVDQLRKTITHGKFNHRNVIITPNQTVYLMNFEHANIDTPVRDIVYFIRHYILNKEHRMWAVEWLEAYERSVTLTKAEKKLLGIFLTFPERLISLAMKYQEKQNTLLEKEYIKKLQIRFAQMKEMIWFVDNHHWLNK